MQVLKDTITIQKEVRSQNDLDYDFLRKKGIEYIESLGSALWTDYNAHDPGITILEMLCYAITDLGMRIDLPIEDLLSDKESLAKINQQFYRAADILPNKALTALDYRKLFIDLDGVTREFFADQPRVKADWICSIGHGDRTTIFGRSPRPDFDKFNRIA